MRNEIFELLQRKAGVEARLALMPYSGTPEIKKIHSKKYLYMRKRVAGKLSSDYVGDYSEELHEVLLRNSREEKALGKELREINRSLAKRGYRNNGLNERVRQNMDFVKENIKTVIYDQSILEGVQTTPEQTEAILCNGIINGMTANDVLKVQNLRLAWEFILNPDVMQCDSDYSLLCMIAETVNRGFYYDCGRIRSMSVSIGGSTYVPPIPMEQEVMDNIQAIQKEEKEPIDIAIKLCLYCMKTQIFVDGNKRASVIFANHFLISKGQGFLTIPAEEAMNFTKMLVAYYEERDTEEIKSYFKNTCWKNF